MGGGLTRLARQFLVQVESGGVAVNGPECWVGSQELLLSAFQFIEWHVADNEVGSVKVLHEQRINGLAFSVWGLAYLTVLARSGWGDKVGPVDLWKRQWNLGQEGEVKVKLLSGGWDGTLAPAELN